MKKIIRFICLISLMCVFFTPNTTKKVNADVIHENNITTELSSQEIIAENSTSIIETTAENANIVSKNLTTGSISHLYFDVNSSDLWAFSLYTIRPQENVEYCAGYFPNDDMDDMIESSDVSVTAIIGTDDRIKVEDTTTGRYKMISRIRISYNNVYNNETERYVTRVFWATGFLEGPNIFVTAGHCLYKDVTSGTPYDNGIDDPRFPDEVIVMPATYSSEDGVQYPYGTFKIKKIFIQKEYYDTPNTNYDWAVCVLNDNLGYITGWNGRISNMTLADYDVTVVGYPSDDMHISNGKILETNTYRYHHDADTTGGTSGGPMYITTENGTYVCGIHTTGGSYNGGTKFNTFIYSFISVLLPTVEISNYYVENGEEIPYNCLVRVGWCIPNKATNIVLSQDGNNYDRTVTQRTTEFYPSATTATIMQCPYNYVKAYYSSKDTYSDVFVISNKYTSSERSTRYSIRDKTDIGDIISTEYNANSNVWVHSGQVGQTIKGTIAYNGSAKNIEVVIPEGGENYSQIISLRNSTTQFQLQATRTTVSIKATSQLTCDNSTIFAFAVI